MSARILLCGAVYGSTYSRGLALVGDGSRIAGVLGRGGASSRAHAQAWGVPYHQDVESIDATGIDAACVAVGGPAGVELAAKLLARRIPVLQEHPLSSADIEQLQGIAAAHGVVWHLNNHFGELPSVAPLILGCQRLRAGGARPLYVSVTCNPRTLFSLLDMLRRALGPLAPLGPWHGATPQPSDFLSVLTGSCAGVQLILTCQRTVSAVDDGSGTLVCHHVEIAFEAGVLELVDLAGPVLWRPNPGAPEIARNQVPMWDVPLARTPPLASQYQRERDLTSATSLLTLLAVARGHVQNPAAQSFEHQLEVARVWESACEMLGAPIVVGAS